MKRQILLIASVALLLMSKCPTGWTADDPKVVAAAAAAKEAKLKAVTSQLTSGDAQQINDAIKTINEAAADESRRLQEFFDKWSAPLLLAKRYDDAAALALACALNSAGTLSTVENALRLRVRALLNAGKIDDALQTAKSLYNACSLPGTSAAIELAAQVLVQAHKDDPAIGKKFKLQQLAAADTNATVAVTNAPSLLAGIKVNPQAYQEAIDRQLKRDTITARSLLGLGTLYLLADQPDRAEELYKQAYDTLELYELGQAIEGLARTYRAKDGNVRRANAYIIAERSKVQ